MPDLDCINRVQPKNRPAISQRSGTATATRRYRIVSGTGIMQLPRPGTASRKLSRPGVQPTETKMRKIALTILGTLLSAGLVTQTATASEHHHQNGDRSPKGIGEQFRNTNDSTAKQAPGWCSQEPGNPYNEQTDYASWSAWQVLGAWDSRNDCQ